MVCRSHSNFIVPMWASIIPGFTFLATRPKNVASVRRDKAEVRRTKIRLGDLSYGMKNNVSVSRTKLRLEE